MSTSASTSSPEPGGSGAAYAGYGTASPHQYSQLDAHQYTQTEPHSAALGYGSPPRQGTNQQRHFSAAMRDRQARGKDPYTENPGAAAAWDQQQSSARGESLEMRERRAYAVSVLDNPELLMQYANSRGDSIAGARLHFTRLMCGVDVEGGSSSSSSAGAKKEDKKVSKKRNKRTSH